MSVKIEKQSPNKDSQSRARTLSEILSNIRVIIFDLDDTLIDSERIYQSLYQDLGIDLKLLSQARNEVKSLLGDGHVSARNRLLYFKRYLELKKEFSTEVLLSLMDTYERKMVEQVKLNLQQTKNIEYLQNLSKKFKLGVVTNENLRTQSLKVLCLDPKQNIFNFILTSEEVGFEKPHSRIMDQALSLAQVPSQYVLAIGDSIKKDLNPYRERGCKVIGSRQFRDESKMDFSASLKNDTNCEDSILWIEHLKHLIVF